MRQFVYFSTAASRQDEIVFAGILAVSRQRNLRDKITGLLVAGGHRYLQVIEGPQDALNARVERIRRDQRHQSMSVLVDRPIHKRNFAGWSMAFHAEPMLEGFATFQQLVDQMHDQIIEPKLRDQLDCFARSFAVAQIAPIEAHPSPWTVAERYDPALALGRRH